LPLLLGATSASEYNVHDGRNSSEQPTTNKEKSIFFIN